uniref:Uncharacterized protein n=1 Tax=Arundo donax TaxID=35708 RepID=A0A0A9AXP4_ARUDO
MAQVTNSSGVGRQGWDPSAQPSLRSLPTRSAKHSDRSSITSVSSGDMRRRELPPLPPTPQCSLAALASPTPHLASAPQRRPPSRSCWCSHARWWLGGACVQVQPWMGLGTGEGRQVGKDKVRDGPHYDDVAIYIFFLKIRNY